MAGVTIRDVRKGYGAIQVLHGVSIDVANGKFLTLVGPSGCGKSTLLRMIAGLEEITGGTVSIGGRVVNDLAPKSRDIAMVFQNYALYPHMTVRENMGFSMKLRKAEAGASARRVEEAAEILGLSPLLDRTPKELSGGQRQRVAMGRAIIRDPQVFLFDEPLSNLDAKLRVQMRTEIKALHQRLGTTVIYVTHDQVEAMTMADRIVVMNGGRIEQIGAPLVLYDRPANHFVASFIGSPAMNFLKCALDSESFVLAGCGMVPLPCSAAMPMTLGHPPEHVAPDPDGAEGGRPARRADLVEDTGGDRPGGTGAGLRLQGQAAPAAGDRIRLRIKPARVHRFDPTSGMRRS